MFNSKLITGALAAIAMTGAAQARDQIEIVGSSTVFPFATTVAEQFGRTSKFKTPVIESTGSGGGMKLFCAGIGLEHPDITNASRRIKEKEFKKCQANGIDLSEVVIGFDGIVLANAKGAPQLKLTLEQIYLATAKKVPDPNAPCQSDWCEPVKNPYQKWSAIDASLPAKKLKFSARRRPPARVMRSRAGHERWFKAYPHMKKLKKTDKKMWKKLTRTVRDDGAWIDAGENDNLMVSKLVPILTLLAFLVTASSTKTPIKSKVRSERNAADFENIAGGKYKISRSLFFYIKHAHVGTVPGIQEFVAEFTSEKAFGEEGYLVPKGLIPLPSADRATQRKTLRR